MIQSDYCKLSAWSLYLLHASVLVPLSYYKDTDVRLTLAAVMSVGGCVPLHVLV